MGEQKGGGVEEQKRATHRVPFAESVEIHIRTTISGTAVDIGAGGIGLLVPVELPLGKQLEVSIFSGAAVAHGTVRWIKPDGDQWRVGIQFRKEDWAIMETIESLRGQEG